MTRSLYLQKLLLLARGISTAEFAFLTVIADHLNEKAGHPRCGLAWPGYSTIQREAKIRSRATVARLVKSLKQKGLLVVHGDGQEVNCYEPQFDAIRGLCPADDLAELESRGDVCELVHSLNHPGSLVKPPVVHGVNQGGLTSEPDRPRDRPIHRSKNAPPGGPGEGGGSSSRGGGSGAPDAVRVTDLIRNEDVNRRLLRLEELMAGTHFEKSASTLTPETLAARTAGLWNDWKGELGEYPDPETVAAVLRSRRFITLRSLNWGVLTSDKPNPKGTPFRARLYAEVVHEHRLRQQTQKPQVFNAADAHAARVEELKREAVRLPIPADEYDRLPRWLQHKVLAEWDDPTVRDWVAEELAKPERETPTLSDDCPGDERERPLGYGYDACEIENQLHALA